MRYASVCSGVEAASLAWHPLGWQPVFFSEIKPFPSALLAVRYPDVPNLGDMTRYREWPDATFDVLVGGTPCQSFSVAGLRAGLADPRGNLALVFLGIANRFRPAWVVWENVPGVLSSDKGEAFGAILGGLAELGYGWAYRVLDAQYFGVAQRRRRVFVVGYLGDWRCAAAVLFEPESLSGDSPPRRETGQRIAGAVTRRIDRGGANSEGGDEHLAAGTLNARTHGGGLGTDFELGGGLVPVVSPALKARDAKGPSSDGDGDGAPLIATHTLRGTGFDCAIQDTPAVAFDWAKSPSQNMSVDTITAAMRSARNAMPAVQQASTVRRLTPEECEVLQGMPRGYTHVPVKKVKRARLASPRANTSYREIDGEVWQLAADGPRYEAIGNSFAVPAVRWIGERIEQVHARTVRSEG